jgi:hypothetical protein
MSLFRKKPKQTINLPPEQATQLRAFSAEVRGLAQRITAFLKDNEASSKYLESIVMAHVIELAKMDLEPLLAHIASDPVIGK